MATATYSQIWEILRLLRISGILVTESSVLGYTLYCVLYCVTSLKLIMLETSSIHAFYENKCNKLIKNTRTRVILYIHCNILSTYFNPREWYGYRVVGMGESRNFTAFLLHETQSNKNGYKIIKSCPRPVLHLHPDSVVKLINPARIRGAFLSRKILC